MNAFVHCWQSQQQIVYVGEQASKYNSFLNCTEVLNGCWFTEYISFSSAQPVFSFDILNPALNRGLSGKKLMITVTLGNGLQNLDGEKTNLWVYIFKCSRGTAGNKAESYLIAGSSWDSGPILRLRVVCHALTSVIIPAWLYQNHLHSSQLWCCQQVSKVSSGGNQKLQESW